MWSIRRRIALVGNTPVSRCIPDAPVFHSGAGQIDVVIAGASSLFHTPCSLPYEWDWCEIRSTVRKFGPPYLPHRRKDRLLQRDPLIRRESSYPRRSFACDVSLDFQGEREIFPQRPPFTCGFKETCDSSPPENSPAQLCLDNRAQSCDSDYFTSRKFPLYTSQIFKNKFTVTHF